MGFIKAVAIITGLIFGLGILFVMFCTGEGIVITFLGFIVFVIMAFVFSFIKTLFDKFK